MEDLAREIAKLHKPIVINFADKFGLAAQISQPISQPKNDVKPSNTSSTKVAEKPMKPVVAKPAVETEEAAKPKQKVVCHSCAEPVPYNVAKFCWFNKPKFGGNVYCVDCQKTN